MNSPSTLETIIVGGGQAGLVTAYHLKRAGRECLVLDANERTGDGWRHQWDSLRLFTPAKYNKLPGMEFPADPWSYPGKDEVADYLEAYARRFDIPVRHATRVLEVTPGGAGYRVVTDRGTFESTNVVVATGTFGRAPRIPDFAGRLDPAIRQLHSSEYRRPAQLPKGPVLVVGASHSGMDIAYELSTERTTVLAGRDCGEIPAKPGTAKFKMVFPVVWFVGGHILSRRTPIGRAQIEEHRQHGGPALRVKRGDLEESGVEWVEQRVVGVTDGRPALADGRSLEVASVVWATGFRQQFDWIDLPVFDQEGWPREVGGVVKDAPGLYFCGLCFQRSFRSMLMGGAGSDAEHVVRHLLRRDRQRVLA